MRLRVDPGRRAEDWLRQGSRVAVIDEAKRRRWWWPAGAGLSLLGMQLLGTIAAASAQGSDDSQLEAMACFAALGDLGVRAEPATIEPAEADCIVEEPVRLRGLAGDREVLEFPEPPILACGFALALTKWLAEAAMPAAVDHLGQPIRKVLSGPGYACRARNQQPGAELSVHGFGIALDIRGFELADGEQLMIEPGGHGEPERIFLDALRTSACAYFTTVLGPGSDPHHEDHLHVDLESRGSSDDHRLCD